MTPDRFRKCLDVLGWSQRGVADTLGCADSLTRGWARGKGTIPADVAAWLEDRARHAEATPPPQDWRRRPALERAA